MNSRRQAYTLLESLVVISLIGVTMTTVSVALHGLFRIDRSMRDEAARQRVMDRLFMQIRFDAHGASEAVIGASAAEIPDKRLTLSLPDGVEIRYDIGESEIVRQRQRGDVLQQRESYRLAGLVTAEWHVESDPRPGVLSLVLHVRSDRSRATQSHHVQAGLDLLTPRAATNGEQGEAG